MNYTEQIKNIIDAAPIYHPFMTDCKKATSYLYDGKVVYVTSPSFEAYTYPVYDRSNQSLVWSHIEFTTHFEEEMYVGLSDLLVAAPGLFESICSLFDIPDIDMQLIIKKSK